MRLRERDGPGRQRRQGPSTRHAVRPPCGHSGKGPRSHRAEPLGALTRLPTTRDSRAAAQEAQAPVERGTWHVERGRGGLRDGLWPGGPRAHPLGIHGNESCSVGNAAEAAAAEKPASVKLFKAAPAPSQLGDRLGGQSHLTLFAFKLSSESSRPLCKHSRPGTLTGAEHTWTESDEWHRGQSNWRACPPGTGAP